MGISRDRVLRQVREGRRDRDLARTPSMGPLVIQAAVAVVAALAGAIALYLFLAWLLGVAPHPDRATSDQQKLLADMVKIALGLAAGVGAAVALIVGYRRARVEEAGSHRDDRRLFSSRYQDAAELLGHDKAAVRLAGIYAIARLADDWAEQRQQCLDVLCAYLRLPYDPEASEPGEREVRLTVIRLITAHLQPEVERSWQGHDLDFTGAVFDGGNFSGAVFSGGTVHFGDAVFASGTVDFSGVVFAGGVVDFSGALFSGGTVHFHRTKFSGGTVHFHRTKFSGGTVDFTRAAFSRGDVSFEHAEFSGGTVGFTHTVFSGGSVGLLGAVFSGGTVAFSGAVFSGGDVNFDSAAFSGGTVTFEPAAFDPLDIYSDIPTMFSGSTVTFGHTKFSGGTVNFSNAVFESRTVDFARAVFSGGEVDLSATTRLGSGGPLGLPEGPREGLKIAGWM